MVKEYLSQTITAALRAATAAGELALAELPPVTLEVPPDTQFGDYASNVALTLARQVRMPPREVAQRIAAHILPGEVEESTRGVDPSLTAGLIERVEVAGAGFLNFYLRPDWLHAILRGIHDRGEAYGRSDLGHGEAVQVEYVSANPTGPLSVPHGRGGAVGDVLASLLDWAGYRVSREFYVNDAGGQIERFGRSVEARFLQLLGRDVPVPEDGYHGDYVRELAARILEREGAGLADLPEAERLERFMRLGRDEMLAEQKATLERFGVHFDAWYLESDLHRSGKVEEVIRLLTERGDTYEADGALWLRSTAFGDDKDRPLLRSNGKPTYIAPDLAYHLDKFRRGFNRVIDVWGPDHHGYIARTKAGIQALGYRSDQLDILIFQHVRLYLNGEMRVGSKRAGDIIPLDDVIDEVGKDAARFFYLMRTANSPLDFDLDLAKREAPENPVYYVQYAHARVCSILREAVERQVPIPDAATADLSVLTHPAELAMIRKLADFPDEVQGAAETREPHRMTRYAQDLASTFHAFYRDCWVLGQEPAVTAGRLVIVGACRIVLRNVLTILGVSAPESM
jgi:arginyl-tRNA synthetase